VPEGEGVLELVLGSDGNTLPSLLVIAGADDVAGGTDDVTGGTEDVVVPLRLLHAVQPESVTIAVIAARISAVFKNFIENIPPSIIPVGIWANYYYKYVYNYSLPPSSTK